MSKQTTLEQLFQLADQTAAEGVDLLANLIQHETVNTGIMPTGNEMPLCQHLRDWLTSEGIASQIYESGETRGNLVARLPGSQGSPRLLFMGHLDVVPVEGLDQWRFPPFSGTMADGRIWGRGAADMKDMVAAELMALVILRRAGAPLRGDLIVAAAADEETGGAYGFGWLAKHAPEAIRADYAINEGGGGPVPTPAGMVYTIQTGEKGRYELRIHLHGQAAHAAAAWHGDNVSFKLGEVLRRLGEWQPEINVSHEIFKHLPALFGRSETVTAQNVDALSAELAQINVGLSTALRGLSRMTMVPTMFSGGIKSNSVPASGSLTCDIRTLPHQDEAYVRRQIDQLLAGLDGVSYELICTAVTNASPYDTPLSAAIRAATAAASGRDDLLWLPNLEIGFTDSRLVRPLGGAVYGYGPGHPGEDLNHPAGVHGANESSEVANLLFRTKLYLALALELLGE